MALIRDKVLSHVILFTPVRVLLMIMGQMLHYCKMLLHCSIPATQQFQPIFIQYTGVQAMRVTQHQDSVFLENCKFDIAGQPGYYNFQKQLHFATGNKKSEAGQTNPCLMANKMAAACLFTSFQIIAAHNECPCHHTI